MHDFLESVTKLSEQIGANIARTFELTNKHLDNFHQAQLQAVDAGQSEEVSAGTTNVEDV